MADRLHHASVDLAHGQAWIDRRAAVLVRMEASEPDLPRADVDRRLDEVRAIREGGVLGLEVAEADEVAVALALRGHVRQLGQADLARLAAHHAARDYPQVRFRLSQDARGHLDALVAQVLGRPDRGVAREIRARAGVGALVEWSGVGIA